MNVKYFYLTLALIVTGGNCLHAQSLSMEVIGSCGDHFSASGTSISWTLGEVMSETYTSGSVHLTQGFHQPEDFKQQTDGIDTYGNNFSITVFPNPAKDFTQLFIEGSDEPFFLSIYDASGKLIISRTDINNSLEIPTSNIERGMYFIHVTGTDGYVAGIIKFQKI